jgi:hypothetical protein
MSMHRRELGVWAFLLAACCIETVNGQGTQILPNGKFGGTPAAGQDQVGYALACDANRVLVSSPGFNFDSGRAFIFDRNSNGQWTQKATLVPADGTFGDYFGESVALHGDRAVVGSSNDAVVTGLADQGSVYVYERTPAGAWPQVAKIVALDGGTNDYFGASVSLDGDRLLVGASGDVITGSAYIFERSVSGTWSQVAKLNPAGAIASEAFGLAVSLSGDRAAIGGMIADTPAGVDAGAAYVFERQGPTSWVQVAKLTHSGAAPGDYFGRSVSLHGDRVIVGAPDVDTLAGNKSGAAYVFERQGSGAWTQVAKFTAVGGVGEDQFGTSTALDGDHALVGAPQCLPDNPSIVGNGVAYLFERSAQGMWGLVKTLKAVVGVPNDRFGCAVSIQGERAFVGARQSEFHGVSNCGAFYGFRLCVACATPYGTGTPGCQGTQTIEVAWPPEIGMALFALTCVNAPPSTPGIAIVGNVADPLGSDAHGYGILLHVDVLASTRLTTFPFDVNSQGVARAPIEIPNEPLLAGQQFFGAGVWQWTSCSLPPLGYSSSRGLALTILPP